MVLQKQYENSQTYSLNVDYKIIETSKSVKLHAIINDSQLRFDEHKPNLCNKAFTQLNAINSLQIHMGSQEMKVIINSFIHANFKYCPLVISFPLSISVHANSPVKLSIFKNAA